MTDRIQARLDALVAEALDGGGDLLALTGAGVSAESGIPTFRGDDGYWRVGSRNWVPEELATHAAFRRMPDVLWGWYLHRISTCAAARPNAAHEALAAAERRLGERFLLVTQNVDGLHRAAGSSAARCYEIHGNIRLARCADGCGARTAPLAASLYAPRERDAPLDARERDALTCHACGGWLRPHVLWFDECYDEESYRFESSLRAAARAALLLVVGTSGSTNLPSQLVATALERGIALIVVGTEPSRFMEAAARSARGVAVLGRATEWVPRILAQSRV